MKTTKLISGVVSILIFLAFALSYAEEEKAYVLKDDEEIYGTWVNTEYGRLYTQRQKCIMYADGRFEQFSKESDTSPFLTGTFTIIDKSTDSEKNIWYKTSWKSDIGGVYYHLDKISNSGTTWESLSTPAYYPLEMDPTHPNYRIYYRK